MNVSEILNKAADLIEPEGAWTQGHFARRADGAKTGWTEEDASCFCVSGAIKRVAPASWEAWNKFDAYCRQRGFAHMATWNDAPERTQAEVVAALRAAAEKAAQ